MNKIIVYNKVSGVVATATFLGNQWWLTTKNEVLEPLEDSTYYYDGYRYLCDAGDVIQMKDLALMLGCALENAEDEIHKVLQSRLLTLRAQDVKFEAVPQELHLKLHLFSNDGTQRGGNFSITCEKSEGVAQGLFDLDSFDDAETALYWAQAYCRIFTRNGVNVKVRVFCTEAIKESVKARPQNWKWEEEEEYLES